MRCKRPLSSATLWIFLAAVTATQFLLLTTAATGVSAAAPPAEGSGENRASGNYERHVNSVRTTTPSTPTTKTAATLQTREQSPSLMRRSSGGGNSHENPSLWIGPPTEAALARRRPEDSTTDTTFDGGGGGSEFASEEDLSGDDLLVEEEEEEELRKRQGANSAYSLRPMDRSVGLGVGGSFTYRTDRTDFIVIGPHLEGDKRHRAAKIVDNHNGADDRIAEARHLVKVDSAMSHHHQHSIFQQQRPPNLIHDSTLTQFVGPKLVSGGNPESAASGVASSSGQQSGAEGRPTEARRAEERPPPVMVPLTEDEIDDERIFYDIVDSKHLISLLPRFNGAAGGEGGGRGGAFGGSLLMGGVAFQQQQQHQQRVTEGSEMRRPLPVVGTGPTKASASTTASHAPGASSAASTTTTGAVKGANGLNADGSCTLDDPHCSEMEAIHSLHKKLDDDANGNIDFDESTDFLRSELKYDSGFENRHRVFHFNDDMHISVRELWEAWRRSEVHNWTVAQTTEWLAQSVQLPQYVELFKHHKVTGAYLPRLAVDNMQYLNNVLGIKDPIHKQKIALKAMDVVLFGPPRETGTRWKDYILVTLLLSVIVGCWYGYQQNKNSKTHLRRMAKDMEGLQKAEQALTEMQKELERARLEQENVATEKMDLERRLKETPSLSSSSSDLEVQQLKQEVEMLRRELSRAEIELVDHCWSPPQGLQTWLQLTYELESKSHLIKRRMAEKQLLAAREACEKLKKKRTSLVGAFVSTHGKSIDDVDRSIVEARNSLGEVTTELQERMHRWKQIEQILGFNIVNNNGIAHLETILYARNGSSSMGKLNRANRMSSSQDELDDESVQGRQSDSLDRSFIEDSSASDENEIGTKFVVGGTITPTSTTPSGMPPSLLSQQSLQMLNSLPSKTSSTMAMQTRMHPAESLSSLSSSVLDDNRMSISSGVCFRAKKANSPGSLTTAAVPPPPPPYQAVTGRTPMPPPRKSGGHMGRTHSTDLSLDSGNWAASTSASLVSSTATTPGSIEGFSNPSSRSASSSNVVSSTGNKLVHQLSTTSTSTSSTESAPVAISKTETPPSTDSSVVDEEVKKRRRKIHFPFGKRSSKTKSSSSSK